MTTPHGYAMGVDLGTSNTVAVVRWPDGRTRALLFDGAPVMPSAVYLDEAGALHVGRDALRLASLDPSRLEPNPKRHVAEQSVLLGGVEVSTVDLLAAVLGAVARAAVEAVGFLPPAALTYPAAWGARRREVLAAAAVRAGWPPVRYVPEPVAAARYFAGVLRRPVPVGGCLAVFDFGGGTLDIAVVRNSGHPADRPAFEVVGDGGLPDLGGLDVDEALVTHLGTLLEQTRPAAWAALASTEATIPQLRLRRAFWEDVRGAKEMLSRTAVAPVAVPNVADAVHLTREELDRIADPLLRRAVQETAAVIGRCGLRPDQLAGLFLVGGSSRLPIVARLLHATLGVAPTVLEQPELPVAEGAILELVPPTASAALAPGTSVAPPQFGPVSVPAAAVSPVSTAAVSAPPGPVAGSAGPPPGAVSAPPGSASPVNPPGPVSAPAGSVGPVSPSGPVSPPGLAPRQPSGPPSGTPPGEPGAGMARRWYRHRLVWISAAAFVVLVVAVTTVLAVVSRGEVAEVPFASSFAPPAVVPGVTANGYDNFTELIGDRLYFAVSTDIGLTVGGYDIATNKTLWTQPLATSGDSSPTWQDFWVQDGAVLLTANTYSSTDQPYTIYGFDGDHNGKMWTLDYASSDQFLSVGDRLVFADDENHQLHFLDPHTGGPKAGALDNSKSQNSTVYPVVNDGDLSGPANFDGNPPAFSGSRLIQIGADGSVRVVDVDSGKEVAKAENVDQNGNVYLAYNDRLYVADVGSNGYQLFSYPLATLKDPTFLHDGNGSTIQDLEPCGGRICVLDQSGSDGKAMKLRMLDAGRNHPLWTADVPGARSVLPVGDRVVVSGDGFTRLYAPDGTVDYHDLGLTWVRVNAASLLIFSQSSSSNTQGLTGYRVRSRKPTSIGDLNNLRTESCSWDEKYFACATDSNVAVWRLTS